MIRESKYSDLRKQLKYGEIKKIADVLGYNSVHVSNMFRGNRTMQTDVLEIANKIIQDRKQKVYEKLEKQSI
jgi:hypothetical protein